MSEKLKVVFLVSGFPTPDNPSHGIFNKRAAMAICGLVDLTVIQFRIFKPGRKLVERIKEEGYERIILCVPYSPIAERQLYYFNNKMLARAIRFFAGAELKQAKLVHAGDGNVAVVATWLKKRYSFKVLGQFIGGDINNDLPAIKSKSWMKNFASSLDAVSFNSKASLETFHHLFGSAARERVIYRGVNTSLFSPAQNKNSDKLNFYYLGGLPNYSHEYGRKTKGGYLLMEAWDRLEKEYDNIVLRFAGPDGNIDIAQNWRNNLKDPGRVELFGRLSPERIPAFHREGDVCLIPSLAEGLPNVAMEAMSTGNLVIATQVGGIRELITHGENGLLCDKVDADSLYTMMEKVILQHELIKHLGSNARVTILENFSNEDFGKKYFNYYQDILSIKHNNQEV
jgi:glycosyltransferase involved in cell wall biosynthesis